MSERCLEIGAGDTKKEGYVQTDIVAVQGSSIDAICKGEELPFKDKTFDIVCMKGTLEHFTWEGAKKVLRESYRVLKQEGRLKLTAPDLIAACKIILTGKLPFAVEEKDSWRFDTSEKIQLYAMSCLYGGQDRIGMVHQWCWTKENLEKELLDTGFKINKFNRVAYEPGTHLRFIAVKKGE